MKNRKQRLVTVIALVIALVMTSVTISFGAAKTKKMTAYDDVIKKGNYAVLQVQASIKSISKPEKQNTLLR